MLVMQAALKGRHLNTALCSKVYYKKYHRLAMEETWAGMETALWAYGHLLDNAVAFKYLSRILTAMYDEWMVVMAIRGNTRKKWEQVSRFLEGEGGNART